MCNFGGVIMKTIQLVILGLSVVLTGISAVSKAEDIDIYGGLSGAAGVPNVLIILDNGASFSASTPEICNYADGSGAASIGNKVAGTEQCALYNTVRSLPTNPDGSARVNLGFMFYGTTGIAAAYPASGCASSNNGGCLIKALTPMTEANKASLMTWIKGWDINVIKANNQGNAMTMQEAWAYYAGNTGASGRSYSGIKPPSGCQKNFIIYIGNAYSNNTTPGDNGSPSGKLAAAPAVAGISTTPNPNTTPIVIPSGTYGLPNFSCPFGNPYTMGSHGDTSGLYADEWARYMRQTDIYSAIEGTQKITTYTIGALGPTCNAQYPALLKSMATYGGGKYFAVDANSDSSIANAILKILNEVQAVNSVFSSSSLPVSVNAQGTYLNQIYMGMFRPDTGGQPRWLGNLKQYQFNYDAATGNLTLGDKNGNNAISAAGTGFISPNAVSFWTSKNSAEPSGGFWKNYPLPNGAGGGYDSPDGELVEKGGAAQMLRLANLVDVYTANPASTTNPRKLYTYCPSGSGCTAQLSADANAFDRLNNAITDTMLGTNPGTDRSNLTQWVRGEDNNNDESGPGDSINIRPSVHGDVLHSRPTVINYGGTTGVVVFYGSNDGTYRAINGNQTNPAGSTLTGPGSELWSFIPSEFYGKLKRLHDNKPLLSLPSTPAGIDPTPKAKDYFVDGSTGTYQLLNADGTTNTAYLYLAMRRGGRLLYALNVSAPTNPQYLWKISNTDTSGDFTELGQTWSQPKVAKVKGYANPVLIFGAGYDTAEDSEPPTADTMGRGIFIVDAITGTMIWSATYGTSSACSGTTTKATCSVSEMNYSIPADITLVDRDSDGKVDRLYAVDTGGNVWRVDLQPTATNITPDHWQVNKVAALGCPAGACEAGTTPRKFFYPVDVVPTNSYDAILVGSGDREHPLYSNPLYSNLSYSIKNRFYMLKDLTGNDGSSTATTEASLFDATSTAYIDSSSFKGFYVTLRVGEKVVNAPTTVAGYTYFGTNQPTAPSANSCTATLGIARGYSIKPLTGTYTSTEFDGGGLPPSPVSGLVNITVIVNGVATTRLVPFLIGGGGSPDCVGPDCSSSLGSIKPPINVNTSRRRAYWYKN